MTKQEKNKLLDYFDNNADTDSFFKIEDRQEFLEKYSPWHQENDEKVKGKKIITDFVDIINKGDRETLDKYKNKKERFSWSNINRETTRLNEAATTRYGVPNHVIGDFDSANLFLCLINPNISVANSSLKKEQKQNVILFGEAFKESNPHDPSTDLYTSSEQHFDIVQKHIVNVYETVLGSEIQALIKFVEDSKDLSNSDLLAKAKEICYYFTNYFYKVLCGANNTDTQSIQKLVNLVGEKKINNTNTQSFAICNLESYPFRSKKPNEKYVSSADCVTLFAARIILRRIYKYASGKLVKPIFIFRGFEKYYKPALLYVLEHEVNCNGEEFIAVCQEDGLFIEFSSNENAVISPNNLMKVEKGERIKIKDMDQGQEEYESICSKVFHKESENFLK